MHSSDEWRPAAAASEPKQRSPHSPLVAAWHVLSTHESYHDLGGDHFLTRENPDHDDAEHSVNSNASATASPSNPSLTAVRPSYFGVNSGHFRCSNELG